MKSKLLEYRQRLKGFLFSEKFTLPETACLPPEYNIQEILPINCRESEIDEVRINLLVPALSIRFSFGGINTALDFFTEFIGHAKNARIIITDEAISDLKALPKSEDWKLVTSEGNDMSGLSIVCFGDRYNKTIPVRKNDVFIATAWWTSYNGERILNWQKEKWGEPAAPLIYLIQDFEPGFYKWSSRYLLALSTYHQKNMIAVINTSLLYEFVKSSGIILNRHYIFEPGLNRNLASHLNAKTIPVKKKRIIFYGRPSVERNAYEIIVKGLELWSFWHTNAKDWEIISLGEIYPNIRLGNDIDIIVKGKVTLDEYANLLLDSAIGISLMVSPHPSYPPLEMAAFNLGVVTNKFSNKDLSNFHDNIFSLDNINPENMAIMICDLCSKFENNAGYFLNRNFRNIDFLNKESGFDFIKDLKCHLPSFE
ncbi:MAG: hypothetical protein JWR61_2501 [Ferruginibacter sp.]|uniref:rhamnosyltransferase WsaF family glycosyltransferase n=1 Tax=Ferruginibacter sp. TaxID=1940288 RepID=UPI0026588968|nr:hypothetical protein [Ferruginibacter sp.]MDB5277546.1 hypothetical protein [Ferruginibacter sp.]